MGKAASSYVSQIQVDSGATRPDGSQKATRPALGRYASITGLAMVMILIGCSGGSGSTSGGGGGGNPPPPPAVQYSAPQDNVFAAAIDPADTRTQYGATIGKYAGARTYLSGSVKAGSSTVVNQSEYAQIFKSSDGHIYRVNLLTSSAPAATQVSSESHATIDDLCSLNGANSQLGTDVNYVGVQYYNDFQNSENSAYFYRLPGSGGTCNTSSDLIYMVHLGMSASSAPIAALMPLAVVHDPTSGAIVGFIVNEGTALTEYDQNFQNRTVLLTPSTPIGTAYMLANRGVISTGALFVLDGNIVYVDYAHKTVSASLFTVPNWSATSRFPTSSNGTTEYFSVNTTNQTQKPIVLTSAVYSMPLNGSAAPTLLGNESGVVNQVTVAQYGTTVAWAVVPPGGNYTVRTFSSGAAQPVTALTASGNSGSFVVTANAIYYTVSTFSRPATTAFVYANTLTGIVGMDGTVIEAPVVNSRFVAEERDNNGSDWLDIIRARNLTPVTLVSASNNDAYTEDGISGATLEVIDTSTNNVTLTLGTLPSGTIMQGAGTLTATAGYIDGINVNSTTDPATRDLIYIDTSRANSLIQLTTNLH